MKRFLLFLLLLVAIAGAAAAWAFQDYQRFLQQPIDFSSRPQTFTIEKGWSARRVSRALQTGGFLDKPYWFDLYVRLSQLGPSIKSGEYVLDQALTVPALLDKFVAGQTRQYSHTLIEGLNIHQTLERLAAAEQLTQDSDKPLTADNVMAAIGKPDLHPEGQFFADTYSYPKETDAIGFLQRAHDMLNRVLEEEWANRAPDLPLDTPYEALILASIVEKETAVAEERPLIAQVFLSRLQKNMRLQTDPTVIYGIGQAFDGNIRRKDLTTDTPYNTYTRGGLPPTPIAMVGREAIHAVLHPQATTALYFVSRGDGTHQFSDTVEQHNAAVRKYQLKR